MEIIYRRAGTSDYQSLQKLYEDVFEITMTEENYGKYIADENHTIWLAECGECCGSICVEKNWDAFHDECTYFLRNVGVSPSWRKRGICTELLKRVMDMAERENIKSIELTSANHRQEAHMFYLSHGFTKKKTTVFIWERQF